MKRCSTSRVIREIKIKATVRCHYTHIWMVKTNKPIHTRNSFWPEHELACTGTLCSIALHCALKILLFTNLKSQGNPVSGKSIGPIFPTAAAPFVCLCYILAILKIFPFFFFFHCYHTLSPLPTNEFHSESMFVSSVCSSVQQSESRYPANTFSYMVLTIRGL